MRNFEDEQLQNRLVALTRDLILIPSTENRPAERHHCFEFLHNHLDGLSGITVSPFDRNGHESLVARPTGVDAPQILLCGHLDVIEHPQTDCYHSKIADGRIYGPGAGDMKGQDAILIELFSALHVMHPGISLGLMLTSDEERGGTDGVRYLLDDEGIRCGRALIPDGGSLNDVTVEEKGVLHARLTTTGHEAHGARPWLGENAVERLMDRLAALRQHFAAFWPGAAIEDQVNHWFPTCSVTMFDTPNTTPNRIPDHATAVVDIRFPPPRSVAEWRQDVERILGPECHLEPLMTAEPTCLEPDPLFVTITREITGRPVRMIKASGGSDGRFFRRHGIPVNLSRPLVGNLHAIDEWIDIHSMVTYYRICETYIRRRLGIQDP